MFTKCVFCIHSYMRCILLSILGLLSSCTYSVIMNHTEGQASDVVDTNPTANADIKPNIEIPLNKM